MLPGIPLTEATDTTRIHSVAGLKASPPSGRAPYEARLAPAGSDQIVAATGG
jgi:hypothetical protein